MALVTCAFSLPNPGNDLTNGSKFVGTGWATNPTLTSGDQLQVTVTCPQGSAPATLNGYLTISPALDTNNAQTIPSPFKRPGSTTKFLCFQSQMGVAGVVAGGITTFTFGPLPAYPGGTPNLHFELTFVAEDPATGTQWSEDPEFETGGGG